MMNEEAFERWLIDKGYQKTTAKSTVRMVRRAKEAFEVHQSPEPYKTYLKRWLAYAAAYRIGDDFTTTVGRLYAQVTPDPYGASTKPALTLEQWRPLTELVFRSTDPLDVALSAVLSVVNPSQEMQDLMTMALREVQNRVEPAVGAKIAPFRTRAAGKLNLIEVVCGVGCTYEAAYTRMRRRLAAYGKQVGADVDIHAVERTPWDIRSQAVWR